MVVRSVRNRFKVRLSSRGKDTGAETEADACVKSQVFRVRVRVAFRNCDLFPLETDDGDSSAPVGSVPMTLAMRCNRAVRDVVGSE